MKEIASAFVKAQKAFAPALKTNTNPHFKSRYVGLDGCIEAVIDALNSNGIALLQPTHEDSTGVTVETVFLHESGEMLSGGKLHVPASKQDPQGYGSALTYARRYSLMSACGIAPEDDDGNAASKPKKIIHRPVEGAAIPDDEKPFLDDLARDLIAVIKEQRKLTDGMAMLHAAGLEPEQKIYLWSLLPSDVRSQIKTAEKTPL